jgi:hypothetical protein
MLVDFVDSLKSSSDISFGDNSKGKVLGLGKFVISSDSSLKNVMSNPFTTIYFPLSNWLMPVMTHFLVNFM